MSLEPCTDDPADTQPARPQPAGPDAVDPLVVARRAQDGAAAARPEPPRHARRLPTLRWRIRTEPAADNATGGHDPVEVLRSALTEPVALHPAPAPEETAPAQTAPAQTAPAETAPAQTAPAQTAPTGDPKPEPGADWLPELVEYRSGGLPRALLGVLFVATVVGAVLALFSAASAGSGLGLLAAVALGGAAGLLWWALLAWAPTIVSLSQGLLEVSRGDRAVRVDLRSPDTAVDLGADTSSLRWRAVVRPAGGRALVLRRHQVEARQFVDIVGFHRRATGG